MQTSIRTARPHFAQPAHLKKGPAAGQQPAPATSQLICDRRAVDRPNTWHQVRKFLTIKTSFTGSTHDHQQLTSKAQTTVPQPVRVALGLPAGDEIAHLIEDGRAIIAGAVPQPAGDPFQTFSEWESEADRKAYGGL